MKRARMDEDGKSNIDHTLTCLICHDILKIPTRPIFACSCPIRCCLHCIISYLMLDIPQNDRIRRYSDSLIKCLLCDARVDVQDAIKSDVIQIDFFLMQLLDAIYPNKPLSCNYCDSPTFSTQQELYKHIQNTCPNSLVECTWCDEPVKRNELNLHISSKCSHVEKCVWCNKKILYKFSKNKHKATCRYRKLRCVICDITVPLHKLGEHFTSHNELMNESTELVLPNTPPQIS